MEAKQQIYNGFLHKPDNNTVQALYNLDGNEDFKIILNWLLSSSGDVDDILRNAESEVMLHRAQGASRVLLSLVSHATNPGELLAKIKRQQAGIVFQGETPEAMPSINV